MQFVNCFRRNPIGLSIVDSRSISDEAQQSSERHVELVPIHADVQRYQRRYVSCLNIPGGVSARPLKRSVKSRM